MKLYKIRNSETKQFLQEKRDDFGTRKRVYDTLGSATGALKKIPECRRCINKWEIVEYNVIEFCTHTI